MLAYIIWQETINLLEALSLIERLKAIRPEEAKQLLPMPNLPEREIGNG